MDFDTDTNQQQQTTPSDEMYSLFDDRDYDENWTYFKNVLENEKEKFLDTEFTGLFEKCSTADFIKFIEEPNSFNVLYETMSLPRHFPLKRTCPKIPNPFLDLEESKNKI